MGRKAKKLYLFDPITTVKVPTNTSKMVELVGTSSTCIMINFYRETYFKTLNCFLCDDTYSIEDLKRLMEKCNTTETINEIWKFTDDTKRYQVSNLGRVRKINKTTKPTFIIPYINSRSKGLLRIKLSYGNKYKEVVLHKVVADLFVFNDDPINKTYIVHKNGIKTDNRANNLEYVTKSCAASLGGKTSVENKGLKRVIRKEIGTGKITAIYDNMLKAEKETGIKYQNIYGCIIGLRPSAGSSEWEFEN